MKNNDDFLARQGDVYTLVDANGYLVREDISGERKKYLLEGEGGGNLPENIVSSVNGQTGDVTLEIPVLPENIVTSVNGQTGDIDYPKFVVYDNNNTTAGVNFANKSYLGELAYFKNPANKFSVFFPRPREENVKDLKNKYVIVKTSELFDSLTLTLTDPTDETLVPWITNKEFVMEPNKTYLISCNYPLATIVELENVR